MTLSASTVFCDEIRQEYTGKHILIGVYGADIVPTDIPCVVHLAMWVTVDGLATGGHRFAITVKSPKDAIVVSAQGQHTVAESDLRNTFIVHSRPILIDSTGDMVASISFDGAPDYEVGRLRVRPAKPLPPKPL